MQKKKVFEENAVMANIDALEGSLQPVLRKPSENGETTDNSTHFKSCSVSNNEQKMTMEHETTENGAGDDNEMEFTSISSVQKLNSRKVGTYESNTLINTPDDSIFDSAKCTDEVTLEKVQQIKDNGTVLPVNELSKANFITKIPQKSKRMKNERVLELTKTSPYHDRGNGSEIYRESEQILGKCFVKEDSFRNVLIEKLDLCNTVPSSENYGGEEFCEDDLDESDCVSELDCTMSEYNSPISRKHSRIPRINRSNSLMSFKRRCSLQSLPHHSSRRSSISSRRSSTLSIDERPPWNYGAGGTPYQKMYPYGKKRLSVDNYYD